MRFAIGAGVTETIQNSDMAPHARGFVPSGVGFRIHIISALLKLILKLRLQRMGTGMHTGMSIGI